MVTSLSDIPELVTLVNSAYRGDASRVGWTTEADLLDGQRVDPESIEAILVQSQHKILCICSKMSETEVRSLVTCVHLSVFTEGCILLGMLSVAPQLQNQGLGSVLMNHAEAFARDEMDASRMAMKVISVRSELIAYYERRGYVFQQKFEDFPYGNEKFGIPKRNDLRFALMEKIL